MERENIFKFVDKFRLEFDELTKNNVTKNDRKLEEFLNAVPSAEMLNESTGALKFIRQVPFGSTRLEMGAVKNFPSHFFSYFSLTNL